MRISQGVRVSVEFTVKTDDHTVVESNVGGELVVLSQGAGQVFPAIERAIEGMAVGETRWVTLAAEQAYGPVRPEAVQEVQKSEIAETARQVGAVLQAQDANRETRRARVIEVLDDVVVVDFNHPLAGENLSFEIRVLELQTRGPEQGK